VAEDPYELVYAEAVRALEMRRDALESLRSRAGVVLSAAAIASSLFGSQAVRAGLGTFGWIAVFAFLALSLALLLILWPRNDWQDTSLASQILAKGIEVDEPLPIAFIRRDLALDMERVYLRNTDSYARLARSFRAAVMLLNLEVLAWILALATGA
jgi:preprotein translocase subunit SecG